MTYEEQKENLKKLIQDTPEDILERHATHLLDWAETDTYVREKVRGILTDFQIDGDSYGVPTIEDIVDRLCDMIVVLQKK